MLIRAALAASLALAVTATDSALAQARIAAFSTAPGPAVPPPWRVVTLPKIPQHTLYTIAEIDGRRALKAEANASYANVVHVLTADLSTALFLRFSWRVDRFPQESNLATKQGDDLAAKVCVLFDLPLDRLSFIDRTKIELGRRLFEPDLPAATICYVWDRLLPAGTWLDNAYTDRVRMLVLRSAGSGDERRWFDERRDLRADFQRAFPREAAAGVPGISAIALATDADNTRSQAQAWFGDISLAAE